MTLPALTIDSRDGIVCAILTGDIDVSNVPQIRREIGRAVSNQAVGLVVDMTAVDYLDSAGMHLVHNLRVNLRSHGQRLALVIPHDSVINDALRLAGVDWAQERVVSCEDAVNFLGSPTSADG